MSNHSLYNSPPALQPFYGGEKTAVEGRIHVAYPVSDDEESSSPAQGNHRPIPKKKSCCVQTTTTIAVCLLASVAILVGASFLGYDVLQLQSNEAKDDSPQTPAESTSNLDSRSQQIKNSLPEKFGNEQDEAMEWLVRVDSWMPPTNASSPDANWQERYALAKFYYSTSGPNWDFQHNWLDSSESVCEWNSADKPTMVRCDRDQRVTELGLGELTGILTGWYQESTNVNGKHDVDYMQLAGSLPDDIFVDMTRLARLAIGRTGLSGPLPRFPISIQYIGTAGSNFGGTIPRDHFADLVNLRELGLSENGFSGAVPKFHENIEGIWLNSNSFSGSIDPNHFTSLSKLHTLSLSDNNFSGPLPRIPENMVQVWLNENNFSGPMANDYFKGLTRLYTFVVADNRLTGSIPSLPQNLRSCHFNSNCFIDVSNGMNHGCITENNRNPTFECGRN